MTGRSKRIDAMRRPNREVNIFNLSMLDVMTGALGAVMIVMIVLLTQKIGVESMSCQEVKEELVTTAGQLADTTLELQKTREELEKYRKKNPEAIEKVSAITKVIDSTSKSFSRTVDKIAEIRKDLFKPAPDDTDMVAFKIPSKILMVVDLSGSMDSENNRYKEDRLSQVKAAIKMFIAAMDSRYSCDIVYFPAFAENIDEKVCPGFKIKPGPDPRCRDYELRDEAYDNRNLVCYKYGYFEGELRHISSEKDKYIFYKKIACLKAYHDTPTSSALEFILSGNRYKNAEGIILFSDGQPDALRKKIMSSGELLKKIRNMNAKRKKIFTVGIGTEFRNQEDSQAVEFLKKLAVQNGGFYIGF